ncbi:peptidase, C39 family [Gloeomargarita lithophora Alchichica-D10]|uniref:Peptidase, C39 family n=1 Tax=Gloeomargarita lithophora Alchichica-D10 TaxID=1188229 RepID=A0A1J0AEL6_9CYAN|nr:cysteine peptidase family C39 domain-containing protein [Gloeomargarita lithophora]APB34377.1 peptidase, C39 family [Gloeomargarita lithophora Alchichica-D10]
MYLLIISGLAFLLGLILGQTLVRRGITWNMDLSRYQKQVYVILGLLVVTAIMLALIGRFHLTQGLPVWLLLIIGESPIFSLILGWTVVGVLVKLSLRQKPQGLIIVGLLSALLSWQIHRYWPIAHLVDSPSATREQVVLQSTPYSCSAASVATLARLYSQAPDLGEREVISLTATSRQGTTSLREWWALFRLGLHPQFHKNLTLDDLAKIDRPALLHVHEPVGGGQTILHAVVLLDIQPEKQTIIIGNPLYGRQEKSFSEMTNYWTKEAIFITPRPLYSNMTRVTNGNSAEPRAGDAPLRPLF